MFSIGAMSGDRAGLSRALMLLAAKKYLVWIAVRGWALSCCSKVPRPWNY